MATVNLGQAFASWRSLLGEAQVLDGARAALQYGVDTGTSRSSIAGAVRVRDAAHVARVVRIAHANAVPLYPISTGHNWGYGSANPVAAGSVVVDLSALNRILDFDPESGCVTLEPGVTQADLARCLEERGLAFMVPVTGAGPSGSILGNALERGYGITPFADHFGAVRALRAILPNGEEYVGALAAHGALTAHTFKWGIGPYLDGLFCQGAFGIVTQMTVALARRPAELTAFFFWIDRDEGLEGGVAAVREILRTVPGHVGGINLMNAVRLVAMETAYPHDVVARDAALSAEQLAALKQKIGVSAWMGAGAIYAPRALSRALRKHIRAILRPHSNRVVFFDRTLVKRADQVAASVPRRFLPRARATLERMSAGLRLLDGYPSRMALPLAYWKRREPMPTGELDPARHGCGLLWYAPLVPLEPAKVREFVTLATAVMAEHRFEALITLTSLSDCVYDCTMPILFDGRDPHATARAEACYRALFAAGKARGFVPYRVPAQLMDLAVDPDAPSWKLVAQLKRAVDPHDLLARGRYAPLPEQ